MGNRYQAVIVIGVPIISILISVTALCLSYQANQTAEKSYQATHQSLLPIIQATRDTDCDEGICTETVTVINTEGTVRDFIGFPLAYMEILRTDIDVDDLTYIQLHGYFGTSKLMEQGQVFPQIFYRENNAYHYDLIAGGFREAAFKDGYIVQTSLKIILDMSYVDYAGQPYHGWLEVWPGYSSPKRSWDYVKEIRCSAAIMEDTQRYVFIGRTEGATVWNWYKDEILTRD